LIQLRSLAALGALLGSTLALAAEPLTIQQIEKVTGLTGLSAKPGKYDKASRNYLTAKDDLALTVKTASASTYEVWKSNPSMNDQAPVAGLGEDAVASKKGRYVCFKKKDTGICVAGMVALPGAPELVSDSQLLELARLAASQL
jgi:hypothetical protein